MSVSYELPQTYPLYLQIYQQVPNKRLQSAPLPNKKVFEIMRL